MASPLATRLVYVIVGGLALTVGVVMFALWPTRAGHAPQRGAGREAPIAGQGPARILLNEVVFQPAAGEPQWVEILNAGGKAGTLDGLALENHAGEKFPLPSPFTLEAGAVHVVRFPATFLASPGFVQLTGGKGRLDRIAWGKGQRGAARLSRGGYQEKLTPGTSLGRVPPLAGSDPLEWVPFRPAQTSPGRSNTRPAVEILLPIDRAIVQTDTPDLTWYTVAGTDRYRVQIASDTSFGATLFDRTVAKPPVKTTALAPGTYVWRVQAVAADGTSSDYSAPNQLTIRPSQPPKRAWLDWLVPSLHAQPQPSSEVDDQLPTVLGVPLVKQHKDTAMLLLESDRESGQHAWDVDHVEPDLTDPADQLNSVPACMAMLNKYYGGNMSQDRINYQVFGQDRLDPEDDLNWGREYTAEDLIAAAFAFVRGSGVLVFSDYQVELGDHEIWRKRDYVKHGIPTILCKSGHCTVIVGFGGRDNLVVVNDPAVGTYSVPLNYLVGATEFRFVRSETLRGDRFDIEPIGTEARADEPGISQDSDGDGVVDFDETERFGTNPNAKDSDGDELPDKEDIKASVHDPREGYAHGGQGRDMDGDGTPMELDDDADDGGCLDGWEDANKNGRFDRGPDETDNFQHDDDPCLSGTFTNNSDLVKPPSGHQLRHEFQQRHTARFSIRREPEGRLRGRGRVHFGEKVASGILTEQDGRPVECKYGMTVGPVDWNVELTAEATTLADGNLQVTLRASPEKGPSFDSVATNRGPALCGPFSTTVTSQGHPWPMLGPYTLTNGIYRHLYSPPLPPGTSGSIASEVVVTMKSGESR